MTRYTHEVYSVMMGRKNAVASSMIHNVSRLDDASHIVNPKRGSDEDGIRNGNSARPTVRMTPTMLSEETMKVRLCLRPPSMAATSRAPPTPSAGAIQASGQRAKLPIQAPGWATTVL